jgi:hypothetical protein
LNYKLSLFSILPPPMCLSEAREFLSCIDSNQPRFKIIERIHIPELYANIMRRGNSHDSWRSRIRYRIQGKSWEWVSKAVLSMLNLVDRLVEEVELCEMASVSLESATD